MNVNYQCTSSVSDGNQLFAIFEFENRSTPVAQPERFALVRDIYACLGDSNLKTNIIIDRSNNAYESSAIIADQLGSWTDRALTLTL